MRRPFWSRIALVASVSFLAPLAVAGGPNLEIKNGTIAGGGGTSEAGSFRLIGTIAEPSQGPISNGQFRLVSGFPATIGDVTGEPPLPDIFADGFED